MPTENTQRTETRIVSRLFKTMLPIQALAIGLPALNSLFNSLIIGHFQGANALASVGFYGPLTQLITAISCMLSVGSQLICGQNIGNGDTNGLKKVFSTTLAMCVLLSMPFALATQFFSQPVASLLGADGDLVSLTADYIRGMAPGIIFSVLQGSLLPFLQLDRKDKVCTAAVLVNLAANTAGNLLNIFVLKWGMYGAGLCTSFANLLADIVALPVLLGHSKLYVFSVKGISARSLKDICVNGAASALNPACNAARNYFLNNFTYALGGSVAMSAMSVATSIFVAFGCMVEAGYSGSARMISSVLVGERDTSSLRDLPKVMARKAWYLYVGAYALVFILAKPLALLFGADPEHIELYIRFIRIANLWYITNIFKAPPLCIYQALGAVALVSVLTVIGNFAIPTALLFLFANLAGVYFIPLVLTLSEVGMIIVYAVYFTMKAHRLPRSLFELSYIPHTISAPRENRFKAEIRTKQEAIDASLRAIDFCREKKLPEQTAQYCGLCFEEVLTNTIEHGFSGHDDVIDVRMIYEDGHVTVLFRDDCKPFDPVKWLELCGDKDPERGIGIRMTQKLSEKMTYVNSLGWNVLTIRL